MIRRHTVHVNTTAGTLINAVIVRLDQPAVRVPRLVSFFVSERTELDQDEQKHGEPRRQEAGNQLVGKYFAGVDRQDKAGRDAVKHEHDKPFVAVNLVGEQHGKLRPVLLILDQLVEQRADFFLVRALIVHAIGNQIFILGFTLPRLALTGTGPQIIIELILQGVTDVLGQSLEAEDHFKNTVGFTAGGLVHVFDAGLLRG